ncbi:DUF2271 domain-containing protein [Psychromonas sp. MB-3u-54]|uniref:DUF2271 domain-containing protein n=1 Tax=Psychromonas sp. MB-3u-54 TaxID=2058319 RepID=UPI000C32C59E|nr:DUF2271 domain-containing protein [Psychromonas sp. MB-3u-54]PKH01549.1 DUF2271 domain-containing protein [Psychromonas sp. MB-3u-54]
MNRLIMLIFFVSSLIFAASSQARTVNFNTELTNYGGSGAYLVLYLTDANGQYQDTLWVAGRKSKYYKHLRGWTRSAGTQVFSYDGLTGASRGQGETFTITVDVADSLIDSGYQLRMDTAVEDMRENRNDVVVPLSSEGAGKAVSGRGYVKTFTYTFN